MLNPLQIKTINCEYLKEPAILKLCSKDWVKHWSSYLNKTNIIFYSLGGMFSVKLEIIFVNLGLFLVILEFEVV